MKRNTPDHWKMDMLATLLKVGIAQAVGHVEMLLHLTAKQAIHGNIGKVPNSFIAKKCGWDGDPDQFVNALAEARWLDKCEVERFVVHDWEDHCDDATKKAVTRSGKPFHKPVTSACTHVGHCPTDSDKGEPHVCLPSLALPSLAKPEPPDGEQGQTKTEDSVFTDLPKEIDTPGFRDAWLKFEKHKREAGYSVGLTTRIENYCALAAVGPERAEELVRLAVRNGWKRIVFVPDSGFRKPNKESPPIKPDLSFSDVLALRGARSA